MACPFSGDESEATIRWVRRAEAILTALIECDPQMDAADGVSCLDVWRKEASQLVRQEL